MAGAGDLLLLLEVDGEAKETDFEAGEDEEEVRSVRPAVELCTGLKEQLATEPEELVASAKSIWSSMIKLRLGGEAEAAFGVAGGGELAVSA